MTTFRHIKKMSKTTRFHVVVLLNVLYVWLIPRLNLSRSGLRAGWHTAEPAAAPFQLHYDRKSQRSRRDKA